MGNQTANRTFQELFSTDSIGEIAVAGSYYEGQALAIPLYAATGAVAAGNVGRPFNVLDGTNPAVFIGVQKRGQVLAVADKIALKRDGAVEFNFVTTAGAPAVPDITMVGRPVWFVSDNEVSLTPPSQLYPIYAGRIIAVGGAAPTWSGAASGGYGALGNNAVLVEITDAVRRPARPHFTTSFTGLLIGPLGGNELDQITTFAPARRVQWTRMFLHTITAIDVADVIFHAKYTPAGGGLTEVGAGLTVAQASSALGKTYSYNVYQNLDYGDTITVTASSAGNPTVGQFSVVLEFLPMQ